jgi:CheY-like chemotaxis protein
MQSKDKHESIQVEIALLGFETAEEHRLSRIFQILRANERNYKAVRYSSAVRSDILLVNYDSPDARKKKDTILSTHPHIQLVAVSRLGLLIAAPIYQIKGILIAARVLTVIDKVLVESRAETVLDLPQGLVNSIFQQGEEIPKEQVQDTIRNEDKSNLPVSAQNGYSVLVVDDSLAIQKSLELNLSKLPEISLIDFEFSGEGALIKAKSKQYDLIFLDVMMPGIDGYDTCSRLRNMVEYKKTPIVMVSGKTSPLDEVKGVMAGCTTYLTKPVEPESFQKLIVRMLAWLERQKSLNTNRISD